MTTYADQQQEHTSPPRTWSIAFTDHFLLNYGTRLYRLEATVQKDALVREIKRTGEFYLYPKGGLLCIVNKMKVYCFAVVPEGNTLLATTAYLYTTDLKPLLDRTSRVNIHSIGKRCASGVDLEELITQRGMELSYKEAKTTA